MAPLSATEGGMPRQKKGPASQGLWGVGSLSHHKLLPGLAPVAGKYVLHYSPNCPFHHRQMPAVIPN
jgi:hypothetical protein